MVKLKRFLYLPLILILCLPVLTGTAYAPEVPVDSGYLWLINHDNPLEPGYIPPDLIEYKNHRMRPAVRDAYEKMTAAMHEEGIHGLYIQSAYRSYYRQQFLFRSKVMSFVNQGYDEATAIVRTSRSLAYPGSSEHQAGLAVDVTLDGRLSQSFGDTEAGRWIQENCHKFGFIVRYPKDKTAVTRIMYEPWHLRYVGSPHAAFMKEKDLCLEEYIDYLAVNKIYVFWTVNREYYMVSYGEIHNDVIARTVVDTSADRMGENGALIYTTRQVMPVVP
jgi:D-alanyl-D-alanine carboxypeptidase